ncbi:Epsin-3, clathrin recruitment and traffic between the Golgi and endosome [Imshaugia aleurites]|uniref:Epsin-3, clathrin recruitment and traffic between the Golgi and endosome n=1 Tax=Imshaugia aleurites TaxID=172621 RepID=A0A8H3FYP0_9LECA|nr:Epsin-3, clathrin recruitment and traffic between the Golgi and endosome [Imshaugia aleurites]
MPMIYKRFTEKAAEEWRQIYKSLQLLEFLIKNGSERVIDDARSHLSLLKMLRQFHFIDQNGKDQGVNVRNRSKELAELLGDVERIRAERKKARSNRNKFGGVEGGAMSGGMSSGSRYGGFGSEESGGYGAYSGGVYGDGGGYGGNTSGFQDSSSRRDRFEEYDEGDDGEISSTSRRKADVPKREQKRAEPPKPKEPEIDILDFDDDIPPETPPKEFASSMRKPATNPLDTGAADDDDFDDFQSATPTTAAPSKPSIPGLPLSTTTVPSSTQFVAPRPVAPSQSNNLDDLVGFSSISPAPSAIGSVGSPSVPNYNISSPPASAFNSPPPLAQTQIQQQPPRPTGYQAATPNYFTSVKAPTPSQQLSSVPSARPGTASTNSFSQPIAKASSPGGDVFGSLWSTASAGAGIKKTSTPTSAGPGLAAIQREKASTQIWGAPAASSQAAMPTAPMQPMQSNGQRSGGGGALDDLLG